MALPVQKMAPDDLVEVDYQSADGPICTHARGGLLAASLKMLRDADLYDRYLTRLPPIHRDAIEYTLAASWVPMDVMMAHCTALDDMKFSQDTMARQGEQVGSTWGSVLYSTFLKTSRSFGADVSWIMLRQCGRLMQRVYKGGGCTLVRLGRKEALYELHGLPLVRSPYFRATHHASMQTFARFFGRTAHVRPARPRELDPCRIASSFSWD